MRALHLFFQLHQPYSLKAPEGGEHEYFGGGADFREADQKYYQPFFALLERNTQRYPSLKVSLLVSGTWLDQAEQYAPDLVRRLQKLVDLKQVELVATSYYYSLAAFYDKEEFNEQVAAFRQKFEGKFSTKLSVFAAPGLMYHDQLAKWAEKAGFRGALAGEAAGVLDFRSAGRVYEAAGCEDFRVLFENGRISRALARGEDLVMAPQVLKAEDFTEAAESDGELESARAVGGARAAVGRKRATAAEFVRGRAGSTSAHTGGMKEVVRKAQPTSKKLYSAKKLQKELEMASLRGNLISLCLDARMFGEHREEGVVACFDEFFMNWLKVPGNKFLTASEIFEVPAFMPTAEISVKATVRTQGMRSDFAGAEEDGSAKSGCGPAKSGLARVEEVQYALPEGFQSDLEEKLYGLRARVLKTKNEDLRRDFRKLTTMDYAYGEFREDFGKVLEDFEALVEDLLPKPKRLRAENLGGNDEEASETGTANLTAKRTAEELGNGAPDAEPEDDYTVKVHRILKKTAAKRPEDFELEDGADGFGLESGMEEVEKCGLGDLEGSSVHSEAGSETEGEEGEEGAEEVMDEFDLAEAEVQVIAQRMKRSKQVAERELEALLEAEVVTVEKKPAPAKKKKTRRRIVLD